VASFTSQISDLEAIGPVVEIQLAVPKVLEDKMIAAGEKVPAAITVNAMIDTGAGGTCIQAGLASKLGLSPIGVTNITTPSSTDVPCHNYHVRLLFPNNVSGEIKVIEAPLQGQHIQCLLGRDILRGAVLVYIGKENQFTLAF